MVNEWLAQLFEYEVCHECGWDADRHEMGPDPLGLPHAWCVDPIPEGLSDAEGDMELARRIEVSTR